MKLPKLPSKDELAVKFINYPTLNSVFCLILYERWFRLVILAALLFAPLLLLSILKVWTVTPKEFRPVVKISGLDFVQVANHCRQRCPFGQA